VSLKGRLTKLERGPAGRCPLCRDRPGEFCLRIVECVVDADDADHSPPDSGPPPELAPCPRCGWKPRVVEIEDVEPADARDHA